MDSQGLSTLLNYAAMVQSGVMLGKDGSLTAAFEYEGLDIASATPAQQNYQVDTLNTILTQHSGGGCVSHLSRHVGVLQPSGTILRTPRNAAPRLERGRFKRAPGIGSDSHFEHIRKS